MRRRPMTLALLASCALLPLVAGCNSAEQADEPQPEPLPEIAFKPAVGHVERLDPALDALIPANAVIEIVAAGFDWAEGPVYLPDDDAVLFSDGPQDVIYRWAEGPELAVWLEPAGSAGLALDPTGRLVLCQPDDQRVARMDAALTEPWPRFVALASTDDNHRLNGPRDLVFDRSGNLYFTDSLPVLTGGADNPAGELAFAGVYRVDPEGEMTLVTKELTRPSGIGLSPDESVLYVANADPARAVWTTYALDDDGVAATPGRAFFDATSQVDAERSGLPSGLTVDREGNLFATGPGGVLVLSEDGKHLGTLVTKQATAGCSLGGKDGRSLFIAADEFLLRVRLENSDSESSDSGSSG